MKHWNFPPATPVTTDTGLRRVVDELQNEPLLAVDTESNSLYAYNEQVCLIQLSTRTQDYIVDPLVVTDMAPLGELMANPKIEKVFHAAEYDIMCMKRDFGYDIVNLFDTMVAARIRGHKAIGLSALLEKHVGVKLDKSHQRDDWGHRPLSKASLRYAQMDTHYLPPLRDFFYAKLVAENHMAEAQEIFADVCKSPAANGRDYNPDGYWGIGVSGDLNRYQMGLLKALYDLREDFARERDVPPFKIFGNKTLVELAKIDPDTLKQLKQVRGLSPTAILRYGKRILEAVAAGRVAKLSPPQQPPTPEPEVTERYTLLHTWRKTRAVQRGVESDVIISKHALWKLAQLAPKSMEEMADIPGLGPWRLSTYGQEILNVIQAYNNGTG